jgi:L-serine/L-threonine ammonia-lyase
VNLHLETPLLQSAALSTPERQVWLKMEALQPPGSFKLRGMGLACQTYRQRGAQRFISSSGGNAGIAAAYCGRQLGVPVTVVVPQTTSERAKALILQQGAELIVHGASWQEANALAQSMLSGADALLLSVGGGGLMCGVIEGLRRNGWADVPVIAVETHGADSLAQAMSAGQRVELPAIRSIATSLGARQVCEQAFAWTQSHDVRSALVSDRAAVQACLHFIDDQRVLVEPACGAALSVVYQQLPVLAPFRKPLVIVCGGVTASLAQLQDWAQSLPA